MSRKGNNEGSIRDRGNGRWEGSIQLLGRRFWVRGSSAADVRRKFAELRRQEAVGELVPPSRVTVGEHLRAWLDAGRGDWKPKTYREYESICRIYLEPAFGRVQLQKLTAPMIAARYARWREERDIAGGTLLNVHRVLHRALTVAVRQGLAGRNVAAAVEPPKARRKRPDLWAPEDARRFVAAIEGDRWGALWGVLVGTGCRLGEAAALRWDDLDWEAGTVTLRRSLTWVDCEPVEGEPKTASGTRTVSVPRFALEALRRWKVRQAEERLAAGPAWQGDGRVVTLADGRPPAPWVCRNAMTRACAALGLRRIRLHDLRHFHASLLLAEGTPLPAVSARLGHANVAVTAAIYSHALRGQDAAAAEAFERRMVGTG